MSIKLRKRAADNVANPPASHVALFVDAGGHPAIKDNDGVVTYLDSDPLILHAQPEDPDAAELQAKVFSKSHNGVVEVFVKDDAHRVTQLTNAGFLANGQFTECSVGSYVVEFTGVGEYSLVPVLSSGKLRAIFGFNPLTAASLGFTDATIDFEILLNGVVLSTGAAVTGAFQPLFVSLIDPSDTLTISVSSFSGGSFGKIYVTCTDSSASGVTLIRETLSDTLTEVISSPPFGFMRVPHGPQLGVGGLAAGTTLFYNVDDIEHSLVVEVYDGANTLVADISVNPIPAGGSGSVGTLMTVLSPGLSIRCALAEPVSSVAPQLVGAVRDVASSV